MASLDRNLRRDLENAVKKARRVAEAGARQAVEQLAVGHHEPWSALSPDQRKLRNRLRAHGRQLGDRLDEKKGTQTIDRLTGECAYEHWHRLLFARFLAENDLLVEPESGMALSLDECRELAREQSKDWLVLASEFAQHMLPQIFRAGDPVLEVALPPEKRQELEAILEALPREVFIADDSLGWVYQFWQADQKDAVNASENKIGADELPAVTQLFTEDYMVLFLLHNTLGAWWAGKVLAQKPDVARSVASEDECRAACAVQGIEWRYLRFVREGGVWRPAAGTFPGWPTPAKELTVLDPCMGSGHFLAFALPMLVALRQAEEKLSVAEAVDAVLRDNLFGLELDPRCTQIAAFNVGLTAWKLAGYRPLPALNLACAGLSINAPVAAWTALAAGDALAENAMKQLYELFRQAPTLGSLIDPTRVGGELFVANFDKIRGLLSSALATEESEDAELAVVAQGIAKAATILAERYTLVVTNPPYLLRRKQNAALQAFSEQVDASAKGDLAVLFLSRLSRLLTQGGTVGVVQPQNWMFLTGYRKFRETFLRSNSLRFIACLGPAAFQDMNWWAIRTSLVIAQRWNVDANSAFCGFDLGNHRECNEKPIVVRAAETVAVNQQEQLKNPDARILVGGLEHGARLLGEVADSSWGVSPADLPRFGVCFWELLALNTPWVPWLGTVESTIPYGGREMVLRKDEALDAAVEAGSAYLRGVSFWGKKGIAIRAMGSLPVTIYTGEAFDANVAVLVPRDQGDIEALWEYAASGELATAARALDQAIKVTSATFTKIGFDAAEWRNKATALPVPESAEPTQWLFAGHPRASTSPLHVGVARLLGYRWPRQAGSSFMDCPAVGPDGLESHGDDDGVVCLPSLRGEAPAAERVRALLADAFDTEWSAQRLNDLLVSADFAGRSLDDWLRDGFFEQHCALFHQRPFVWQIWDGRKDGFSALVNYHQLAAPNGEGRRTLDKLTHTYLGDWLDRQRADQKAGVEGADGRIAAAEHLKRELEKILEGEPPYDIFVRWKPLHQQPIGWEPDLDDGVRVNIRPFMTAKPLNARGKNACILRVAPKIKWDKDRGKEPTREKADFPWFWGWDESTQDFAGGREFDGNRWNDLHYSRAAKLAARERAKGGNS
ncbi:Eco57I restriction-modification methylase domain-containing protein [Sorangium sp. So ce362]|uniref:Eco57I restriction-modification methylase domain-containing protein n=1 Tax=Sorangium sp. So ce362 TaxID=3133303 RepID=UPI003F624EA1